MVDASFYWIGVGVTLTLAVAAIGAALIVLYAWLIRDRFGAILFRKSQRRLSLASWYNAKLLSDVEWMADDMPIGERPLYLSYRVGERRLFILIGTLGRYRHAPIRGRHPEAEARS